MVTFEAHSEGRMFASCKSTTLFFACVIPCIFLFIRCNNVKTGREGGIDTIDKGVVMALKNNDFNIVADFWPTVEDIEEDAHDLLGGEPSENEKRQLSENFARQKIVEMSRYFKMIYDLCEKNDYDWDNAMLDKVFYFSSKINWRKKQVYDEKNAKKFGYLALCISDKTQTINIWLFTVRSSKHRYVLSVFLNPFSDDEFEQIRSWHIPEEKKEKDINMSKLILNSKTTKNLRIWIIARSSLWTALIII